MRFFERLKMAHFVRKLPRNIIILPRNSQTSSKMRFFFLEMQFIFILFVKFISVLMAFSKMETTT